MMLAPDAGATLGAGIRLFIKQENQLSFFSCT